VATLRALGFTVHQVRAVVRWHGLTVAAIAAVVAVPAGLALARGVWRLYAGELSLDDGLALRATIVPGVLLAVALLVAGFVAPVGGRLARRSTARDLRGE
jgi:ABC-type spermidine/putrescine transport system permease subunit II